MTQCSTRVYPSGVWGGHLCYKKAKVERGGKWYCTVHDPVRRSEKLLAEREESQRRAEIRRADIALGTEIFASQMASLETEADRIAWVQENVAADRRENRGRWTREAEQVGANNVRQG